ncbi:serpin family protein [Micromonospora sp. SH-82]|uniref:serpin family protein n=1 Tax=Micromonospora sp. SH-82 TaxID=3132938 RepID=UPI003EBC8B33
MREGTGVDAANRLTAGWAQTLDGRPTVLSGAGAYPLLALLAAHAGGAARSELAAVAPTGLPLVDSPTTRLALGVWSAADLPLTDSWLAAVPEPLRRRLTGDPATDQRTLDEWAAERTDGLIPAVPVQVGPTDLLVLVSALLVRTGWAEPFRRRPFRPTVGAWRGRDVDGLHQVTDEVSRLRVSATPAGPLSLLTVPGEADVDVVLALAEPDRPAREVVPAAIAAWAGDAGLPVPAGPGVGTRTVTATDDRPQVHVWTVPFRVTADHDLLEHPEVFGLGSAVGTPGDHFPGISAQPLYVSQARQSATAVFGEAGFCAAAVTAMAARAGAAPRASVTKEVTTVEVTPPFCFLAVHRATGLVLFAGWVTEPGPQQP